MAQEDNYDSDIDIDEHDLEENSDPDMDMENINLEENMNPGVETGEPQTVANKRKIRGKTTCEKIKKMKDGEKIDVIYNENGQPIGKGKKDLSSYIGVLAKSRVRITYDAWLTVPGTLKQKLWESVQDKFDLPESEMKHVLSSLGELWKHFKSTLTRKYITPFRDQPELLNRVPKLYDKWIEQETWDAFVRIRLSEKFQKRSKANSERRAKNKYNHRVGKKGFSGLEEELKAEQGSKYDPADRAFKWKRGHQTKNGSYPTDAIKEMADKIDMVERQVKEGTLITQGSKDVLAIALGNPEHRGRVRAVGRGITPSTFFHLAKRGSRKHISELENLLEEEREKRRNVEERSKNFERQLQLVNERIARIEEERSKSSERIASNYKKSGNTDYVFPFQDQRPVKSNRKQLAKKKGSKSDDHCPEKEKFNIDIEVNPKSKVEKTLLVHTSDLGKATKCSLAVGVETNIVAKGTAYKDHGPEHVVHGIVLGPYNVHVAVDEVINGDEFLPIPVRDELLTIKDAFKSLVAWPRSLVIYSDTELSKRKDSKSHHHSSSKSKVDADEVNQKSKTQRALFGPKSGLGKATKCSLAVGVKTNIVAKGTTYTDHGPEHVVHGIVLGPNNVHVAVDEVINGDEFLPIPVRDELLTIKDAHKSLVAWPKNLVIYNETELSKRKDLKIHRCSPSKSKVDADEVNQKSKAQKALFGSKSGLAKGIKCRLAAYRRELIVAEGTVYKELGEDHEVQGIRLGPFNLCVFVDNVLDPDVFLPIMIDDDLVTIADAHQKFVPWPHDLVIHSNDTVTMMERKSQKSIEAQKAKRSMIEDIKRKIQNFSNMIKSEMTSTQHIILPVETEVFEQGFTLFHITKLELLDVCRMHKLNVNCIITYMRYLHGKFEPSPRPYGFANPAIFDNYGDDETKSVQLQERLNVAKVQNQFLLLPYNPGDHWVLIIIDMSSLQVYWLDSISGKPSLEISLAVNNAITAFSYANGSRSKRKAWELVKCPRQLGGVECGYYVMKFMKHFVQDPFEYINAKMKKLSEIKTYSDDDLTEVRYEWINFIRQLYTDEQDT